MVLCLHEAIHQGENGEVTQKLVLKNFVGFIIKLISVAMAFLATLILLVLAEITTLKVFFWSYVGALSAFAVLSVYLYLEYLRLGTFTFNLVSEAEPLAMDLKDSEVALKVCLRYHNDATYEQIKKEFGFSENVQVNRKIKEGLSILLREHGDVT